MEKWLCTQGECQSLLSWMSLLMKALSNLWKTFQWSSPKTNGKSRNSELAHLLRPFSRFTDGWQMPFKLSEPSVCFWRDLKEILPLEMMLAKYPCDGLWLGGVCLWVNSVFPACFFFYWDCFVEFQKMQGSKEDSEPSYNIPLSWDRTYMVWFVC